MALQGCKSSPQKSRPLESGHRRHAVWIAIEYSYKLGQKKEFKFWCELGWFLQRQSHMEYHDLLEPTNEIHVFALHFIYLKRINFALQQFAEGWNSHEIRIELGLSPNQLFTAGVLIMELMKMTQLQTTLMKLKITMKECQFHVLQCSCQMNNLENCNHW